MEEPFFDSPPIMITERTPDSSVSVRFENHSASVILTEQFLERFRLDVDTMPEFHDPVAKAYGKAERPIQPLSTDNLQLLVAAYMARQEDEMTSRNSAMRRERIWYHALGKILQVPLSSHAIHHG